MQRGKRFSSSTIRTQEFTIVGGIGKRGYDPDEVRDFLNRVAKYVEELEKSLESLGGSSNIDTTVFEAQIEQLSDENARLKMEIEKLKKENEELKNRVKEGIKREDLKEENLATEILKLANQMESLKNNAEEIKREIEALELKRNDLLSQLDAVKSQIKNEILALARRVEDLANKI